MGLRTFVCLAEGSVTTAGLFLAEHLKARVLPGQPVGFCHKGSLHSCRVSAGVGGLCWPYSHDSLTTCMGEAQYRGL